MQGLVSISIPCCNNAAVPQQGCDCGWAGALCCQVQGRLPFRIAGVHICTLASQHLNRCGCHPSVAIDRCTMQGRLPCLILSLDGCLCRNQGVDCCHSCS